MSTKPLLTRVVLKNYKSIAACNVELGPLMFLVGLNGSGKSNFLDALRFTADSLRASLDHALRDRGGINEVRRRSGGHPTHFGIKLEFTLPDGAVGTYSFEIGAKPRGGFEVAREQCVVTMGSVNPGGRFDVRAGHIVESEPQGPAAVPDRLYLVNASGLAPFRPVYDALSTMGFYNINPQKMRDLQAPDPGLLLTRDGANIASVLAHLEAVAPDEKRRVEDFLNRVVPGIVGVAPKVLGTKETLEFRQEVAGARHPWRFPAASMSDGTLRALGVLVSVFQTGDGEAPKIRLVGIEEPEVALHPAATGVLLGALRQASRNKQILVTSHSPDLLDAPSLETSSILAVAARKGVTIIAPIDEAGREALRRQLYTPGELLRLDQLRPDESAYEKETRQLSLFVENARQ